MVDRSQYKDQADKSGGAADDQQRHIRRNWLSRSRRVGAWRVMMTDPPHQTHGKRNRAEPDQHARRPQDEPGGFGISGFAAASAGKSKAACSATGANRIRMRLEMRAQSR